MRREKDSERPAKKWTRYREDIVKIKDNAAPF